MAVSFPTDPQPGDSFEAGGVIYSWDGTRWVGAFTPSSNYTGATGLTGATGPQGPNDAIELSQASDVNENRPLVFSSEISGVGTVPLQTEAAAAFYNPVKNELYAQNAFVPLTSTASQFPLIARNVQNQNEVNFERIATTDGFFSDFQTDTALELFPLLVLPINAFSLFHAKIAVTTDTYGSCYEEIIALNNYDGTVLLRDKFGGQKDPNTFGSLAPSGGNPNISVAVQVTPTDVAISFYSLVEATVIGKAHCILDYMDSVSL